jgi:hypothetical protein
MYDIPPSKTIVKRVSGCLEDDQGKDHFGDLDLVVLKMFVDKISGVAKSPVTGIRRWYGTGLPNGKYTAKFPFEGKVQHLPQRMVSGVLRNG